jgi:hypothetical protein
MVGILTAGFSALAAAECQIVGPPPINATLREPASSADIIDARFRRYVDKVV